MSRPAATAPRGSIEDREAVLDFWFGPPGARGKARAEWFRKDPAFDEEIRRRFGALHRAAAALELEPWRASPRPMLALVVVLDQFSRNLFRGEALAFAEDAHARECAREAVERGDDRGLVPVERQFLYLPFVHHEDAADQDRGVELMGTIDAFEETRGALEWAEKHRAVIRRFGRFPHRNAALARASTPEELEFLAQPGSGF
ncbi:MAG TPA: DUF924 family protein [Usitatibacter sp.]|nr:DUF924 family protein [Usitatibacter sp.]